MEDEKRELRIASGPVEARTEDGQRTLTGYAAVFGQETTIAGLFRELIAPGAFTDAIGRDDVRALWNHDPNVVLGRTTAGTLTLAEDAHGLKYTIHVPDTQAGRDLLVSVARGDVSQSSFGFSVDKEEWTPSTTRGALPLRVVQSASLYDVSPVTYPAYPTTSVTARSIPGSVETDDVSLDQSRERLRWQMSR